MAIDIGEDTRHGIPGFHGVPQALHRKLDPVIRWALFPLLFCWHRLRQMRLECWRVEGEERHTRQPLSLLCVATPGHARHQRYLLEMAFGETYRPRRLGNIWAWQASGAVATRGHDCDLACLLFDKAARPFLGFGGGFFIPAWVSGEVDLPYETAVRKNDSVRTDVRRIRKSGLGFEIARSARQFDDFYHTMYVPYITKAHGHNAYLLPYDDMKAVRDSCDLLMITKQGEEIGGCLIAQDKTGPRLWASGVRDANPEYIKDCTGAFYHFALQHLEASGSKKVNFGWSRAFLRNGVLWFKNRRFAQRIVKASSAQICLKILAYTPATKAFLQNNPFIFERHGLFQSAVFVDGQEPLTKAQIQKMEKDYRLAGIARLFIYRLGSGETAPMEPVPEELAERVAVRAVEASA